MERGRKSRRGRCRSRCNHNIPHSFNPPKHSKPQSLLSSLYNFFILSSLIALIYMMLQYHCQNCGEKFNTENITRTLDDIAKNLSIMKEGYYDLELKISRFSQELPKLEGQIDILEGLANLLEKSHMDGWDRKIQLPLPNVDVFNRPLPRPEKMANIFTNHSIPHQNLMQINQD